MWTVEGTLIHWCHSLKENFNDTMGKSCLFKYVLHQKLYLFCIFEWVNRIETVCCVKMSNPPPHVYKLRSKASAADNTFLVHVNFMHIRVINLNCEC